MQFTGSTILTAGLFSLLTIATPNQAAAQIEGELEATLTHNFTVSKKTFHPGKYLFRMQEGSDGTVMSVTSADGKDSDQFMVRQSQAPRTPAHTELVFRRYGDQEFLSKIYEGGNKIGVAVTEPSKLEKQLKAQGLQATEHTETSGQ